MKKQRTQPRKTLDVSFDGDRTEGGCDSNLNRLISPSSRLRSTWRTCNLPSERFTIANHEDFISTMSEPSRLRPRSKTMSSVSTAVTSRSKMTSILRNFKFYQDMDPRLQEKILLFSTIKVFPEGSFLFHEGDVEGDCFIVLSGSIGKLVGHMQDSDISNDLSAGSVIGCNLTPLSLPSSFSAVCTEETKCLVIQQFDFVCSLKEDVLRVNEERRHFLEQHLPGFKEVPSSRGHPHPALFFQEATHGKGHIFLKQDQDSEESVFVVFTGSVEFSRKDAPSSSLISSTSAPSLVLSRPGSSAQCSRPVSGAGDVLIDGRGSVSRKVGVLLPGGVFGSLAVGEAEFFTVTAVSASVEVLFIDADAISRLPRQLVETLREHLLKAQTWRLENLRLNRQLEQKLDSLARPLSSSVASRSKASLIQTEPFFGLDLRTARYLSKVTHSPTNSQRKELFPLALRNVKTLAQNYCLRIERRPIASQCDLTPSGHVERMVSGELTI